MNKKIDKMGNFTNKKRISMFKSIALPFTKLSIITVLLTGCTNYENSMKVLPSELSIADQCRNINKQFEMDCYDLISYKNTFAQLRLGLNAQYRGNFDEAMTRYKIAKDAGNFYADALIADMYYHGFGVEKNDDEVTSYLKNTKNVDPISAYKLFYYYIAKEDVKEALKLLTFAAENNVKNAQLELSIVYANGEYTPADLEKSTYWKLQSEDLSNSFTNKIYGL